MLFLCCGVEAASAGVRFFDLKFPAREVWTKYDVGKLFRSQGDFNERLELKPERCLLRDECVVAVKNYIDAVECF